MSDYFTGKDLDARAAALEDSRDGRRTEHYRSRWHDSARPAPYARAARGRHLSWASAVPVRHLPVNTVGHSAAGIPVVTTGFGRFVPYTAAAAVSSGQWQFVPTWGGLRVAMPSYAVRAMIQAGGSPGSAAAAIAGSPTMYGYVLHSDTFVPATLPPGDKHLLSRAI